MKKLFSMVLIAALFFCMAACAGTTNEIQSVGAESSAQTESSSASMDTSAPTEEETASPVEGNNNVEETSEMEAAEEKALVVYFSATGITRSAAEELAALTGADLYEIVPEHPYTDEDLNYNDHSTRATAEQNDQSARPAIAGELPDPDGYSVIYVGYPIWWGDMPRILYTFFDAVDFSGKTIAPFCNSGGSGLSGTPAAIATLEPDAAVTDGLAVRSSDQLVQWLTEIGLAQREVTVSDFYISRYEVMQAEYKAVTGENPSNFIRDDLPVESVSWLDAVRYCRSQLEGLPPVYTIEGPRVSWDRTANVNRLPTETEWEYACRRSRWLVADASMGEALSVHYSGGSTLNDDIATWLETNGLQ